MHTKEERRKWSAGILGERRRHSRRSLAALLAVLIGAAWAWPARAAVLGCGAIVGPGRTMALEADVTACGPGLPAVTVVGPVTLDLRGHEVTCASGATPGDRPIGIQVLGSKAKVKNGTVRGCLLGVSLEGEGHTLSQMLIDRSLLEGVYVAGTRNRLKDVVSAASQYGGGFLVDGESNRVSGCTASGNSRQGFEILGHGNQLGRSVASSNRYRGVDVRGDHARLVRNTVVYTDDLASGGDGLGFAVFGIDPVLTRNAASFNDGDGFQISANAASITANSASNNGGDGFSVHGRSNLLPRNTAKNNARSGIRLRPGSELSRVLRNVSLGHSQPSFDLSDGASCGVNLWIANPFTSRSSTCIE
mgnify:CR=1 FL=1